LNIELLPAGIEDAELLVKAAVRKFTSELERTRMQLQISDQKVHQLTLDLDTSQSSLKDAESASQRLERELTTSQRTLSAFEAKVAFLGSQWERLTGEVNTSKVEDPQASVKRLSGELQATKSELFSSQLTIKRLSRELATAQRKLRESDDLLGKWTRELITIRAKDQALEIKNVKLRNSVHLLTDDLNSSNNELHDTGLMVKDLKGKLSMSKIRFQDTELKAKELDKSCKAANNQYLESMNILNETEASRRKLCTDVSLTHEKLKHSEVAEQRVIAELNSIKVELRDSQAKAVMWEESYEKARGDLNSTKNNVRDSGIALRNCYDPPMI